MKVSELLKSIYGDEFKMPENLEDKEFTGYIPKSRFDEINSELSTTKEQIKKHEENMKELEKQMGDSKALKEKIAEIQANTENMKKEYETKISDIKKSSLIETELMKENVKYPDLLMPKIDKEKILISDSGVVGLKEQITNLKTTFPELFSNKTPQTPPPTPGANPDKKYTLTEIMQIAITDPARGEELMKLYKK